MSDDTRRRPGLGQRPAQGHPPCHCSPRPPLGDGGAGDLVPRHGGYLPRLTIPPSVTGALPPQSTDPEVREDHAAYIGHWLWRCRTTSADLHRRRAGAAGHGLLAWSATPSDREGAGANCMGPLLGGLNEYSLFALSHRYQLVAGAGAATRQASDCPNCATRKMRQP